MDSTINNAWGSNVSYNGEKIVQKVYRYQKKRKVDQEMIVYSNTQAKLIISETYPEHVETFKMSADGLHDFVEEIKYHYKGKPMLHKKLLHNFVSQYPNFTQKY